MEENISLFDLINNFNDEMYIWIVDPNSSPQSKRFLFPKFIQEQRSTYAENVGSENDIEIVLKSPITSYVEGQALYFKTLAANTGPVTLDVDGLGAINVVNRDGTALNASTLPAGSLNLVQFDGINFQLLVSSGGGVAVAEIQNQTHTYKIDTGVADAYAIALTPSPAGYVEGQMVSFKAINANTGPSTIDVNGLGVKNIIRRNGTPLSGGDIPIDSLNIIQYDGSDFQLLVSSGGSSINLSFTTIATNNVTINPVNQFNNYRFDRSGDGDLTFNATGVVEGNNGIIKVVKDITVTKRLLGFGNPSLFRVSSDSLVEDDDFVATPKTITNAVNNGAGLIRITAVAHGYTTGNRVKVSGITGTTEANANWGITVIDPDTFDLIGSLFVNAYISGGTSILLKSYLATNQNTSGIAVFSYVVENGLIHISGSNEFNNV